MSNETKKSGDSKKSKKKSEETKKESGEKRTRQEIYNRADADIDEEFDKIFKELANTKIEGMPELTKLLLDDEVMDRFEDPKTIEFLRKISIDPANIDVLKDEPEIAFLMRKVENAKAAVKAEEEAEAKNAPKAGTSAK